MRILFCCLIFVSQVVWGLEFSSRSSATTVIELYTSEGCSSCPPADEWLSTFKQDKRLFDGLLPLAFHVDYWDRLGWTDRFARSEYSQRQRDLVNQRLISQVYTPGFVLNSHEWRGWFSGRSRLGNQIAMPGKLSAKLDESELIASFEQDALLELHVAWLGMELVTEVTSGENRNRSLKHDFVVLQHWQQLGRGRWQIALPSPQDLGQKKTAIAIWLTEPGDLTVIQAAGSYLE